MTYKLVLVRHGESVWNKENRFTGWKDVDLTEKGREEARKAGKALKEAGLDFDVAYTSVLKRAIRTLWTILDEMDLMHIPVERSYRLNERHYGALQGLNKSETAEKHGEEQVKVWRRSFDIPPPPLEDGDERLAQNDPRYAQLDKALLPRSESLKLTIDRVLPYWADVIVPALKAGKNPIIVAHGNSLRALVQYLDDMTPEAILGLNIPTGIPLVYELDADFKPISRDYLGDPDEIAAMIEAVANQGKAK